MVGDVVVSDVFGLGKLAEVVGKGVGTLYEPHHLKKLTAIREEHVRQLTTNSGLHSGQIKQLHYTKEEMNLILHEKPQLAEYSPELFDAAQKRFIQREVRRQINIESAIENAAKQFDDDENVSSENVTQEWIDRFFDSVQDVTDEKLQEVWGKVLAGEVKNAGSFSLRTVEVLKNMSSDEAELFRKCAQGSAKSFADDDVYILRSPDYLNDLEINYSNLMELMDIGILNPAESSYAYTVDANTKCIQEIANKVLVSHSGSKKQLMMPTHAFTKVGKQLLKLVEAADVSKDSPHIKTFAEELKKLGAERVTLCDYQLHTQTSIRYFNEVEL